MDSKSKLEKIVYAYRQFLSKNDAETLINIHQKFNSHTNFCDDNKRLAYFARSYFGKTMDACSAIYKEKTGWIYPQCIIIMGIYFPDWKIGDKITIEIGNNFVEHMMVKDTSKFILPLLNNTAPILHSRCPGYYLINVQLNDETNIQFYVYGLYMDPFSRKFTWKMPFCNYKYSGIDKCQILDYTFNHCGYHDSIKRINEISMDVILHTYPFDYLKYSFIHNKSASIIQNYFRRFKYRQGIRNAVLDCHRDGDLRILPIELVWIILTKIKMFEYFS